MPKAVPFRVSAILTPFRPRHDRPGGSLRGMDRLFLILLALACLAVAATPLPAGTGAASAALRSSP